MTSAVSGPSFTKADILPALKALAWSSLPIVADQFAQHMFFKKTPVNRGTDLTITGLITCAFVIYFLPSDSPARVGAPVLYLAYRAALFYWNRAPKPPRITTQPTPQKSPAKKAAPRSHQPARSKGSATPTAPRQPPAQKPTPPTQNPSDAPTPAVPAAPPKPPEKTNVLYVSQGTPSAALSIPTITFTPASPRGDSEEKTPPKPEEKKADTPNPESASDIIRKQNTEALLQHQGSIQRTKALNSLMYDKAERIPVKVKITYLPKKETETDSKQTKEIVKDPEVIQTQLLINSICLFKLPIKALPKLLPKLKEKYLITAQTLFCWVFLTAKNEKSLFPFDYLPIESLRAINKKGSILKIETEENVFEIEFSKTASQSIVRCLKKLEKCKIIEDTPSRHALVPVDLGHELEDLIAHLRETHIVSNCYLTPLERPKKP